MLVAIIAAICMVFQDIFEVLKMQAAARNRSLLTGIFDSLFWYVSIAGTVIAAFTLHGNNLMDKVWVVALVTAANVVGNLLGVRMGQRFVKDTAEDALVERVAALEHKVFEGN